MSIINLNKARKAKARDEKRAKEFLNRFHGHNERIDTDSLRLTTQLWLDVCDRLWERAGS